MYRGKHLLTVNRELCWKMVYKVDKFAYLKLESVVSTAGGTDQKAKFSKLYMYIKDNQKSDESKSIQLQCEVSVTLHI